MSEADVSEKGSSKQQMLQLELSLRPVRRLLKFARSSQDARVPFLGTNLHRLIEKIPTGGLPEPLGAGLVEVLDALQGVDSDIPIEEWRAKVGTAWQLIHRLDATLGLPVRTPNLKSFPSRVSTAAPSRTKSEEGSAADGRSKGRERSRRKRSKPEASEEVEPKVIWGSKRLETPLTDIKLPLSWLEPLESKQIQNMWDFLSRRPVEEEVISPTHGAGRSLPAGRVAVGGRVRRRVTRISAQGELKPELLLYGAGPLYVHWHRSFTHEDLSALQYGQKVVVAGQALGEAGERRVENARLAFSAQGKTYVLSYGLEDAESIYHDVIAAVVPEIKDGDDVLSSALTRRYRLLPQGSALKSIHSFGTARADAVQRLAFDELLVAQLGRSYVRFQRGSSERGLQHSLQHHTIARLEQGEYLKQLSDSQQTVLEEIKRDLLSRTPMARLLLGPGNAGSLEVMGHTMMLAADDQRQVLVVGADANASRIMEANWQPAIREAGLSALRIEGKLTRAQREAWRRGEHQIAFADPSVFELNIEWRRLGLVLLHTEAAYGAYVNKARSLRTPTPDLLVVPNGLLPAERLFDAYATLDISWLEAHKERKLLGSRAWSDKDRGEVYRRLAQRIQEGHRGLIMLPVAHSGEEEIASRLKAVLPEGHRVEVLDPASPLKARVKLLQQFRQRRIHALVTRERVELLSTLPDRTIVLVEDVHQMSVQRQLSIRGMTSHRGVIQYIAASNAEETRTPVYGTAKSVLESSMVQEFAEHYSPIESMQYREQPTFRWADTVRDLKLLILARLVAHQILRGDPGLSAQSTVPLARLARVSWPRIFTETNPLPRPRRPQPRRRRRRRRRS